MATHSISVSGQVIISASSRGNFEPVYEMVGVRCIVVECSMVIIIITIIIVIKHSVKRKETTHSYGLSISEATLLRKKIPITTGTCVRVWHVKCEIRCPISIKV